MASDMSEDLFSTQAFGQIALNNMGKTPSKNGDYPTYDADRACNAKRDPVTTLATAPIANRPDDLIAYRYRCPASHRAPTESRAR